MQTHSLENTINKYKCRYRLRISICDLVWKILPKQWVCNAITGLAVQTVYIHLYYLFYITSSILRFRTFSVVTLRFFARDRVVLDVDVATFFPEAGISLLTTFSLCDFSASTLFDNF